MFFIGQQELVIGLTQEKTINKNHISILKALFLSVTNVAVGR